MRDLDHELHAVGTGQPIGEMLLPIGLKGPVDDFHRLQEPDEFARVRHRVEPARAVKEPATEQFGEPPTQKRPGERCGGWVNAGSHLPDGMNQLLQVAADLILRRTVFRNPLPPRLHLLYGLIERGRQWCPDPRAGAMEASLTRYRLGHSVGPESSSRWKLCLSISRYSVVRSMLAKRAAFDMLPPARPMSRVRYSFSNCATIRSLAR